MYIIEWPSKLRIKNSIKTHRVQYTLKTFYFTTMQKLCKFFKALSRPENPLPPKITVNQGRLCHLDKLATTPSAASRLPRNRISAICVHCAVCQNSQCALIWSLRFSRLSWNKKIAIPFKSNQIPFTFTFCICLNVCLRLRKYFSCCRTAVNSK